MNRLTKAFDPTQPRDDRGRWTEAGAAGLGAAVGAAGAGWGAQRLIMARLGERRAAAYAEARAGADIVRQARARNAQDVKQRGTRHAKAVASVNRNLRGDETFGAAAVRSLRSAENRLGRALREHMSRNAEPFWPDGAQEPTWASLDAEGERGIRGARQGVASQITEIREQGRPTQRVRVAEHWALPRVAEFERVVRGPTRAVWKDEAAIAAMIREQPDHFADLGIRTIDDARREIERVPRRLLRRVAEDWGLPVPKIRRERRVETVQNVARFVPEHERVIDGFPDQDTRRKIRQWILTGSAKDKRSRGGLDARMERNARIAASGGKPVGPINNSGQLASGLKGLSIDDRAAAWRAAEAKRLAWRKAIAGMQARRAAAPALAGLRRLRVGAKAGAVAAAVTGAAAGAGLGALGAWFRGERDLGKRDLAKADDTPPDPAEAIYRAGEAAEQPLGRSIAAELGSWTGIDAEQIRTGGTTLRANLASSMARALAPLDAAAGRGADAGVPAVVPDDRGDPRIITVSFNTGSPRVADYSERYRVKLAGQIADDALATIQTVLRDATLNGQATDVTARLLRQTIGLAPVQAAHVISFRRGLAALDPNVMNRALRDRRFDRTVLKALETQAPLTDEQIDRMVGAYHRRYLAFRAETIARTEGLRAANNGHIEAAKAFLEANPDFTVIKTWFATRDERTRSDHVALNGQQVVGLYTPFRTQQGDTIMWPHDEDAPLRQLVRCRCTIGITLVPTTVAAQLGINT